MVMYHAAAIALTACPRPLISVLHGPSRPLGIWGRAALVGCDFQADGWQIV